MKSGIKFGFICLVFGLVLAACVPVTPVLPTSTVVPSKTATSTPQPTFTPVSTTTPTTTATPFVLPDAPIPDSSKTYKLQTPDPEKLVGLALLNLEMNRASYFMYSQEDIISQVSSDEWGAIDNLIAADLKHHFPDGIPNAKRFVKTANSDFDDMYFIPSETRIELLLTGTIQYLNTEHIQFSDGEKLSFPVFKLIPYSIDLDGDRKTEWLLEVTYLNESLPLLRLPLKINSQGIYELIPNNFFPVWLFVSNMDTQMVLGHDLTGDGKNDVVISQTSYFGGTISGAVSIYTWQNNGLYSIDSVDLRGVVARFGEANQSEYEISDHNYDGRDDILVTWPRFRPFDCSWKTQTIYYWNGDERIEIETNDEIPDQPNCYIAHALESNDIAEQVRWFEAAQKQLVPLSPDLQAFITLRLSAAYAAQGREQDAKNELAALEKASENGGFLDLVRATSKDLNFDALSVCKAMYLEAGRLVESNQNFNSKIDGQLAFFYGYPLSFSPNPCTVCPYWDLLKTRLAVESIVGIGDPTTDFAAKGYTLFQFQPMLEQPGSWVGIMDIGRLALVIAKFQAGSWKIEPVGYLDSMPTQFETQSYKSPNGVQNLLFFLTLADNNQNQNSWYQCEAGQKDYQLMLVSYEKGKLQYEGQRTYRCQYKPPVDISDETGKAKFIELVRECNNCDLMNDQRTGPGWYWLEGYSDDLLGAENIFGYIDKLEMRLVRSNELEQTRQRIEKLMAFLPSEEPAVKIINRRLRYLLGLSYELQGLPDQAVPTYLSIIHEAPNSLWSWLVWTRLGIE